MERVNKADKLILLLQGVIEEECDENYGRLSTSSVEAIDGKLELIDNKCSAIIVSHGKNSLTLGWKLPGDVQLLKEQLEKDWGSVKVDGELECANSLKHSHIGWGSSCTSPSEIKVLMTDGN